MNRIERYFQKSPNFEHFGDFVSVVGAFGWIAVDHEVACTIRTMLDQRRTPEWIEFHDRVGSLIRIRPTDIRCLTESTLEQRSAERRLHHARNAEEKADRLWDED
ncbi:MAG: hypothetical protein ABJB74_16360 [Gemmatimonas sp.]